MSTDSSSLNPETNQPLAKEFIISFSIVNGIASIFNIFINSTLIYLIFKLKLLRNISYRFILCLSLSDLCVGTIVQPFLPLALSTSDPMKLAMVKIILLVCGILSAQTSLTMTTVIALDRYLRVKHLLQYNSHMTKRRANLLIAATVIISIIMSLIVSIGTIFKQAAHVATFWLVINGIMISVICVFYLRAYRSIRNRVADTIYHTASSTQSQRLQRPDVKFMKGMTFILIALLVFYVPYEIISMLVFFLPNASNEETKLELQYAYYCSIVLVYLISSYNAIILMKFDGKLRRFFQRNILQS